MATTGIEREQNRKRQLLKRRRDRVERIEMQATTMVRSWPAVWRVEFQKQIEKRQAAAAKARAEVEKTVALMPEGLARDAYLRTNYRNTKVCLPREIELFLKRKKKISVAEINAVSGAYEGYPDFDDERPYSLQEIDWEDLQQVAWVVGEDDSIAIGDLVDIRRSSIFFGGRGATDQAGLREAVYLLRAMQALPKANLWKPEEAQDLEGPQLAAPHYGP